jgi:sugar phosphate isomerase/epimerase
VALLDVQFPDPPVWLAIGDRIAALQLHDNDGLSDDHQVPGTGTFDFK